MEIDVLVQAGAEPVDEGDRCDAWLRAACPAGGNKARIGAVVFIHRFGALLNPHVHFHCVVVDGLFEAATEACESVRFHETPALCSDPAARDDRSGAGSKTGHNRPEAELAR